MALFFASGLSSLGTNNVVNFDAELDNGGDFNSYRFIAPNAAHYFITLSGGVDNRKPMTITPTNVSPGIQLKRNSDNSGFSTFQSRDGIVEVTAGAEVTFVVSPSDSIYSASHTDLLSAGMFDIDTVMTNGNYFFYGRTTPAPNANAFDYLLFSDRYIDTTQAATALDRHTCTRNGPMYIFATAAVSTNARAHLLIRHDDGLGNTEDFYLTYDDTHHNGNDMVSRAILVNCQIGDVIAVMYRTSGAIFSDAAIGTALGGFYYNPRYVNSVAWAGYRNSDLTIVNTHEVVSFQDILVNTPSGVFNAERVNIPIPGTYLVHFSVGMKARERVDVGLYVGGTRLIASIFSQAEDHNGGITLSRTIMVRLNQGEQLSIHSNANLFSQPQQYETSFTGMLLMPL